jgi:large subunit ribosomal protein L5
MTQTTVERPVPRLKARYRSELEQRLKDELGLANIMQVPRPLKVVVNMGIGEAIRESRLLDGAVRDLTQITGQKPLVTKAKKSIAGFKIREGQSIGAKVTLRGDRMWEFLDRLLSIALPRIRDFRGLSPRSFDGRGNYSIGIREQIIFPEINYDDIAAVRGLDVTITTTAQSDEHGLALLRALGMPFAIEDDRRDS